MFRNMKVLFVLFLAIFGPHSTVSYLDEGDYPDTSDVQTNLDLSPWELYVLGDLTLRITQRQCPKVSHDVVDSLLDRYSDALKSVPRSTTQNEDFLPAYSSLVQCMDDLMKKAGEFDDDDNSRIITETEGNKEGGPAEEQSSESDWVAPDPSQQTESGSTSTQKPFEKSSILHTVSNWLWNLAPTKWVSSIFQRAPAVTPEKKATQVVQAARREQKRIHQMVYAKSRQNFANFFHEMSKIIRKSCPSFHRPDKVFMRKAFLDMTTWLTLDDHEAITLSNHYFDKRSLLKDITECNKAL